LSIIAGHDHFHLISLFVPALRKHGLNHSLSITQTIHKAFDHFVLVVDFSSLSFQNLLLLSLSNPLMTIPDAYWLGRYPRFLTANFFIFDTTTSRHDTQESGHDTQESGHDTQESGHDTQESGHDT
jgi:hypothetical protein